MSEVDDAAKAQPEAEPWTFNAFFDTALKALHLRATHRIEYEGRGRRQRLIDLRTKIAIGARARAFVQSDFWNEDLLPWLRGECADAMRPWRPGSGEEPFSPDGVNARYFFSSGKAIVVEILLGKLKAWIEDADAAVREVEFIERQDKEARARSTF